MSNNQVPQNQICFNRNFNKTALINKTDKSSSNAQLNRFSTYVRSKRNSYTVIQGQVTSFYMTGATPNTATVEFTHVGNPSYFVFVAMNNQNLLDILRFKVYSSPFTITGLTPNAYYTVDTYSVFNTGNEYKKTYANALLTLNEGPPLNLYITDPQYNSATLNFTPSIGNPLNFTLDVINHTDPTDILNFQDISPPFRITGLFPDTTYDISLSSYYEDTTNSYLAYSPALFKTYYEDYTVITGISNITNMGVTITYEYTGTPTNNVITLSNTNFLTDIHTLNTVNNYITFTDLRIDSSYNIQINTIYSATNHVYTTTLQNAFHTLNESVIGRVDILQILGNSILLKFAAAAGNDLQYIVTLQNDTIGYFNEQTYNTLPNIISYTVLVYNTNFFLTVKSVYALNTYTYVHNTPITTLNQSAVTQINSSNVGNNFATVTFNTSPGNSPRYNVKYQGTRINTNSYYVNGLTQPTVNLTGLNINVPYDITVTTVYPDNNFYSYSVSALFTTLNQGLTVVSSIANITTTSFDIVYINTYENVNSYLFTIKKNGITITTATTTGSANNTRTVTINGLTSGQTYNITILTTYSDGNTYLTTYANTVTTL